MIPDDVSVDWVRRSLGLPTRGAGGSVQRIGEGVGLSSTLLRVGLGDGLQPPSVVVKRWALEDGAGDREIRVLQTFGDRIGCRAAPCLHAEVDEDAAAAVMILEDIGDPANGEVVQGDHLRPLDGRSAGRLGAAMGRVHRRWSASSDLVEASSWLPTSPWLSLSPGWFGPRRERFFDRFPGRLDVAAVQLLDELERAYAEAVEALTAAPDTLLHGDLHLDNVLFEVRTGEPLLLDWQRACRGPAALDLADLLAAMADPGSREVAFQHYLDAFNRSDTTDTDQLRATLPAAAVITFAKWTCGIASWKPVEPRSQRSLDVLINGASETVGRLRD